MFARFRQILAIAALFTAAAAAQAPAPQTPSVTPAQPPAGALSPRNANYTITARLDPASRTLTGDELVAWRNTSSIPARSLRFHLYYNAWRNTRSSWMRGRCSSLTGTGG